VGDQEADLENVTRLRIAEAGRWAVGQEWGLTPAEVRRRHNRRLARRPAITLGVLLATGTVVASLAGAGVFSTTAASKSQSKGQSPPGTDVRGLPPGVTSCPFAGESTLGYIASTTSAASRAQIASLHGDELLVPKRKSQPTDAGSSTTPATTAGLALLPNDGVPPPNASPLLDQSEDPALHSCDYTLADKPAAVSLASDAIDALEGNGLLTDSQASNSGDVYLLSDDPLNSDEVVFTIEVPSSNVVPDPEYPGYYIAVGKGPSYAAVLDKKTGAVLALGNAPW
jgi:hypothetical protein